MSFIMFLACLFLSLLLYVTVDDISVIYDNLYVVTWLIIPTQYEPILVSRFTWLRYCKRANIRGDFNFAMFAVDNFSVKLKPPRSFYNASVYSYLLVDVRSYTIIREIKTTAKGPIKKTVNF